MPREMHSTDSTGILAYLAGLAKHGRKRLLRAKLNQKEYSRLESVCPSLRRGA